MKKLFLVLPLSLLFILGCTAGDSDQQAHFKEWETPLPSVDLLYDGLSGPPDLNENAQRMWQQAVIMVALEVSRLSQAGRDISFLVKPQTERDLKKLIENLPGEEWHRAALAFWAVQEFSFPSQVLYGIGGREEEINRGTLKLYPRLLDEQSKSLGYFVPERDFLPFVTIRWDSQAKELVPRIDEQLIRRLSESKGIPPQTS